MANPNDDCLTCAEGFLAEGDERCPNAKRPCGHHCNCLWTHDLCHWCDAFPDGDGGLTIPVRKTLVTTTTGYQPLDPSEA